MQKMVESVADPLPALVILRHPNQGDALDVRFFATPAAAAAFALRHDDEDMDILLRAMGDAAGAASATLPASSSTQAALGAGARFPMPGCRSRPQPDNLKEKMMRQTSAPPGARPGSSALVWLPAEVTLVCRHGQSVPVVAWRSPDGRVHVQARSCLLCGPVRHRRAFGRTILYLEGATARGQGRP
jgi:hypothetical protein